MASMASRVAHGQPDLGHGVFSQYADGIVAKIGCPIRDAMPKQNWAHPAGSLKEHLKAMGLPGGLPGYDGQSSMPLQGLQEMFPVPAFARSISVDTNEGSMSASPLTVSRASSKSSKAFMTEDVDCRVSDSGLGTPPCWQQAEGQQAMGESKYMEIEDIKKLFARQAPQMESHNMLASETAGINEEAIAYETSNWSQRRVRELEQALEFQLSQVRACSEQLSTFQQLHRTQEEDKQNLLQEHARQLMMQRLQQQQWLQRQRPQQKVQEIRPEQGRSAHGATVKVQPACQPTCDKGSMLAVPTTTLRLEDNLDATTLMIRNIPVRYTQEMLLQEWPQEGSYNFLYLPICIKKKCNASFAFVNFITPQAAREFADRWHHARLQFFSARKALDVSLADLQGLEQNLLRCKSNKTARIRNARFQPVVFEGRKRIHADDMLQALCQDHAVDSEFSPSGHGAATQAIFVL
eukprot:gb/GFBE01065636.1/.p1 GENE.gb/GFBE01065636.1/~~gb/GFBE01065636.1/.p1  ORF type:complete len:464 (+),score=114.58 gb/GFBE01065636.1/:1-1392(+)